MNFPSFPAPDPLLSFLPISTVKVSSASEGLLGFLMARFQPAVLLLSFWNLSDHWNSSSAKAGHRDLKASVKDGSTFFITSRIEPVSIMLCRQVSPHFYSCSEIISVPFWPHQKGPALWEEISPDTWGCNQGTKYFPLRPCLSVVS